MSKEWLWWLGEFGLAATVAVVAGFVTGDVSLSILYGLFVGTVFFIMREHRRVSSKVETHVDELENKALNLPTTLKSKSDINPLLKQIATRTRDEAIRFAKEAENGEMVVHTRILLNIMMDTMRLAKPGDKVLGMNYGVNFDNTALGVIARQQQFELAESGVDITRVFVESISASPEDKKTLRDMMEQQKNRINVRFIHESLIPTEARGNWTLIYDKFLSRASMHKISKSGGQMADEIRMYTNPDELKQAKEWAENIIKLSEEYK